MADVDLAAIFNEINTIAALASTTESGDLIRGANAIPRGTSTSDLVWPGRNRGPIGHDFTYTSHATDWGWADPAHFTFGCTWDYGGTLQGAGLYLANLHLYLSIDNLLASSALDVSGSFDDPTPTGDPHSPVAQLSARVTFKYSQFHGANVMDQKTIVFTVRGDGAGTTQLL